MNSFEKMLEQLKHTFYNATNNRMTVIFTIIWLLVTVVISYVTYNSYIKPLLSDHKLNKEFLNKTSNNSNNNDDILIMYFYTEWCPYCKKAKPEWNKFERYINNINNSLDYTITLVSVNCDEDKSIADKYDVEGYPTIKLIYKKKVYDFDAKVTKENLVEFLDSINTN